MRMGSRPPTAKLDHKNIEKTILLASKKINLMLQKFHQFELRVVAI